MCAMPTPREPPEGDSYDDQDPPDPQDQGPADRPETSAPAQTKFKALPPNPEFTVPGSDSHYVKSTATRALVVGGSGQAGRTFNLDAIVFPVEAPAAETAPHLIEVTGSHGPEVVVEG